MELVIQFAALYIASMCIFVGMIAIGVHVFKRSCKNKT